MRAKKKTIREWEKAYGLTLLDLDGFDTHDKKLFERLFTQEQFEYAAGQCTIRKPKEKERERAKARSSKGSLKLLCLCLFFVTMPTAATLLLYSIYKALTRWIRFKWYIPVAILCADLIVFAIQPISPLISGPGYLWYQLFNLIYHLSIQGLAVGKYTFLHQSLNLTGTTLPVFSSVVVNGTHLNFYFSMPAAITSSVYWATIIVCVKDLLNKLTSKSNEPAKTKRSDRYPTRETLTKDA